MSDQLLHIEHTGNALLDLMLERGRREREREEVEEGGTEGKMEGEREWGRG